MFLFFFCAIMNWELQDFGEEDPQLLGGEGFKDHHAHFFHQVIHIYHHINLWLSCSPQGDKPPQVPSVKQSEATLWLDNSLQWWGCGILTEARLKEITRLMLCVLAVAVFWEGEWFVYKCWFCLPPTVFNIVVETHLSVLLMFSGGYTDGEAS